ncbi:Protein-disulfide isomerase [Paenibacillus uliginis N3/975]|uniref:Protein-disulfide isomerase n=1 Tax=Paenibacillus uliginis N3/975 TaxID=1313296 RepID=A0A1X7H7H3_9BACL|nr:DsbA family protein [Paenibacillus uliginis]SMF81119.1 Protein-disulfide isomerase [Paenibacillus uliginis N3/975]
MGESKRKKSNHSGSQPKPSKSVKPLSQRKRVFTGIILGLLVVAAITTLFVLNNKSGGEESMKYPDLNQVQAGEVPKDFDVENQPVLGDSSAPFQIVEFSDYKCPYCKMWTEEVFPRLKTEYIDTGKANFVYVDMAFLGPDSILAALAGETLYQMDPAYFWKYHELMTERQGDESKEWATYSFITDLVEQEMPEVPLEQFKEDLKSEKYIKNIKRDLDIANKQGVQGTPTVFVNGVKFEDPTFEEIQAYIEKNGK